MKIKPKEATVKVRMNPNCYIHITEDTIDKKQVSCGGHYDVIVKDNKKERVWVGDETWVTPEYADKLISGDRPIARIIATKAVKEDSKVEELTEAKEEKKTVSKK